MKEGMDLECGLLDAL